jgi:hypothetical protein
LVDEVSQASQDVPDGRDTWDWLMPRWRPISLWLRSSTNHMRRTSFSADVSWARAGARTARASAASNARLVVLSTRRSTPRRSSTPGTGESKEVGAKQPRTWTASRTASTVTPRRAAISMSSAVRPLRGSMRSCSRSTLGCSSCTGRGGLTIHP